MRAILKLTLAAAIVVSTYFAILGIAEHKADALAGGGAYPLTREHPEEMRTFAALLEQLRQWQQPEFAEALAGLRDSGHLFVAPRLAGERSAIYVRALGLVSRVYVRRDELLTRRLPFPDLDVPDAARRTFATITLAGTLYHELQHYDGLENEPATYDREITWYRELGEATVDRLDGERQRWFEWAVESALESAFAAREKATGSLGEAGGKPVLGGAPAPQRPVVTASDGAAPASSFS